MKHEFALAAFTLGCCIRSAFGDDVERLSVNSAGVEGNQITGYATVSAEGRYFAFDSDASNLVAGDTNFARDLFVRDRELGITERVSVSSTGAQANGPSYCAVVSPDGRYVVFSSLAGNLVAGDTNGDFDIFVRDRQAGTTELISKSTAGAIGNGASFLPTASGDLRYVVWVSDATNLVTGDSNGFDDIFVRDRQTNTTTRINVNSGGIQANNQSVYPVLSEDGQFVIYTSYANNLVAGDTNGGSDIFRYSMATGLTARASLTNTGMQANGFSIDIGINCVSGDGRYVMFTSSAPNLVTGDGNGLDDVFVRDMVGLTTKRASVGDAGQELDADAIWAAISADGRFVAFESKATNLVPGDNGPLSDVFVRDLVAATTVRVSDDVGGAAGDSQSYAPTISSDGRAIAFNSYSTNLVSGDLNGVADVFVRARCFVEHTVVGVGVAGAGGLVPLLGGDDGVCLKGFTLSASQAVGGAAGVLFLGTSELAQPHVLGGTFYIDLAAPNVPVSLVLPGTPGVPGAGGFTITGVDATALEGTTIIAQLLLADPAAIAGVSMTNALRIEFDS